ncbi:hypothetical protein [Streptomyces sp. 1222.5]|uniref:hypothetical protein n=1 Tax=Streptomyces sp. 1222.5 TaxID=1881026 RepID=UPI003EBDE042
MNARDRLIETLMNPGITGHREEEATEFVDAFAHELAERIRNVHSSGEGDGWNWWDAAEIPANCADLIDPRADDRPASSEEPAS